MLAITPALSHSGLGIDSHSFASHSKALAAFEQGRQELLESSEICSDICQLLTNVGHTEKVDRRTHSRELKHLLECALGRYVSENELINSAINLGYRWERVGQSAIFAMSFEDLEAIRKALPDDRPFEWW